MTKYIEGTLVILSESGLYGILTSDHMVYELSLLQSIEYLGQDGTWKTTDIIVPGFEGWDDIIENSEPVELGMPVRYGVWQSDEGMNNIPDGTDDELPECFQIWK